MAQQLGVLDVLAEDPGLVPSTNVQCMAVCNSSSRGSIAFFWILQALHAHVTQTERTLRNGRGSNRQWEISTVSK